MSISKKRNSLGTVIECIEVGEESSSLLVEHPLGQSVVLVSDSDRENEEKDVSSARFTFRSLFKFGSKKEKKEPKSGSKKKLVKSSEVSKKPPTRSTFLVKRQPLVNSQNVSRRNSLSNNDGRNMKATKDCYSINDAHSLGGCSSGANINGQVRPASCSVSVEDCDIVDDSGICNFEPSCTEIFLCSNESGERQNSNDGSDIFTVSVDVQSVQSNFRKFTQFSNTSNRKLRECPVCSLRQPERNFPYLSCCNHRSCKNCLVQYLKVKIMESRVQITCPECIEPLHPSDIYSLIAQHSDLIDKYENFTLRRVLMTDPDTRWCPAPDCTYAVIANACAACPKLRCEKCETLFCYHCKGTWHANQTCDEARKEQGIFLRSVAERIPQSVENILKRGDVKPCPRCRAYIVKMNDGSCNHMVCTLCSAQFCWLCLREINDLHYLSPTGCTFWGKKPWTRKKKLLWQVGTLIGAPVGIALIAGLAIPGIIFGVPVFVGRKVNQRLSQKGKPTFSKTHRRLLTFGSVFGSLVVSPVLAVMAVGVGVPIMLAYVYGVVPLSLCRNGGCGVGTSSVTSDRNEIDDDEIWQDANISNEEKSRLLSEIERPDDTSMVTGVSINSGLSNVQQAQAKLQVKAELCRRRPSVESGIVSLGEKCNYEEASTKAMAGSHYCDDKSVHTMCSGQEALSYCEEVASTLALAGSVLDAKSLSDSVSTRNATQNYFRELSPVSSHAEQITSFVEHRNKPEENRTAHRFTHADSLTMHNRDDTTSCGSDMAKYRTRSNASSNSERNFHKISHSHPSFYEPNAEKNTDEISLAKEESEHINDSIIQRGFSITHKKPSQNSIRVGSSQDGISGFCAAQTVEYEQFVNDRFHIRAIFDTMKQIVSDDVASSSNNDSPVQNVISNGFRSILSRSQSKNVVYFVGESNSETAKGNIQGSFNSKIEKDNQSTGTHRVNSLLSFNSASISSSDRDRRMPTKRRLFSVFSRKKN